MTIESSGLKPVVKWFCWDLGLRAHMREGGLNFLFKRRITKNKNDYSLNEDSMAASVVLCNTDQRLNMVTNVK